MKISNMTTDLALLMKDSEYQVFLNLSSAKNSIDQVFGEGYAENHPDLVGSYMVAVSNNFCGSTLTKTFYDLGEKLEDAIISLQP